MRHKLGQAFLASLLVIGALGLVSFGQDIELLIIQAEMTLEDEDYDGAVVAAEQAVPKTDDGEQVARLQSIAGYAKYYLDQMDDARKAFNAAVCADPELMTALIGRAMIAHLTSGPVLAAVPVVTLRPLVGPLSRCGFACRTGRLPSLVGLRLIPS